MEVAKLSAPPNLEVRYVSCNESAKKRCLSSELVSFGGYLYLEEEDTCPAEYLLIYATLGYWFGYIMWTCHIWIDQME